MALIVRTIIPEYQNTNIKKNFIKIVPTDYFTCKAGTSRDIVKINFYASDESSHRRKITLPKVWGLNDLSD